MRTGIIAASIGRCEDICSPDQQDQGYQPFSRHDMEFGFVDKISLKPHALPLGVRRFIRSHHPEDFDLATLPAGTGGTGSCAAAVQRSGRRFARVKIGRGSCPSNPLGFDPEGRPRRWKPAPGLAGSPSCGRPAPCRAAGRTGRR